MIIHKIGDQVETNLQAGIMAGINATIVGHKGSDIYVLRAKLTPDQMLVLRTENNILEFDAAGSAFHVIQQRTTNLGSVIY